MVQAIVGMWRKVGIEATIEVYEDAKHYELRAADRACAPAAFEQLGHRRRSDQVDGLRWMGRAGAGTARTSSTRSTCCMSQDEASWRIARLEGGVRFDRRQRLCALLLLPRPGRSCIRRASLPVVLAQIRRAAAAPDDAGGISHIDVAPPSSPCRALLPQEREKDGNENKQVLSPSR